MLVKLGEVEEGCQTSSHNKAKPKQEKKPHQNVTLVTAFENMTMKKLFDLLWFSLRLWQAL